MLVIRSFEDLPAGAPTVVTIGTFDGVHLGHRKILDILRQRREEVGGRSVLLTFDPHPREIIGLSGNPTYLLTSIDERVPLIEECGVDIMLVLPFTRDLSVLESDEFFSRYIVEALDARHVVVGFDHAFGRGRSGDAAEISRLAEQHGIGVTVVEQLRVQQHKISSTAIRHALEIGDVSGATSMLGREYCLSGIVVRGEGIGSTMGFPTANLELSESNKMLPALGVYAVEAEFNGRSHRGIMNIGRRPTVSKQMHISLEVHIFDISDTLYGMHMKVHLVRHLRKEIQFASREDLVGQISQDIISARELFDKQ